MIIHIHCISFKKGMVKALKKNQIIIFAIALMLITAGYLSYTMNTEQTAETSAMAEQEELAAIGDARLVSNDNLVDASNTAEGNDGNKINNEKQDNNDTKSTSTSTTQNNSINTSDKNVDSENKVNSVSETSAKNTSSDDSDLNSYFTESKLERDKMYSEMLESYQSMLANPNVSSEQKSTAQAEISKINKQRNAIMIAENLIKNKGFKDVVIFVNNDSVSAVIRAEKLETADIAQVQSIIQRELLVNAENIHISNK